MRQADADTLNGTNWAFVVPLAATFDWGRKMFEKGKAIREAKKAEILAKALRQERQRIRTEMERSGVPITPEIEAILSGNAVSDDWPFVLA